MNFCGTKIRENILGENKFVVDVINHSQPLLESTENFELDNEWKNFTLTDLLFFLARKHVAKRGRYKVKVKT